MVTEMQNIQVQPWVRRTHGPWNELGAEGFLKITSLALRAGKAPTTEKGDTREPGRNRERMVWKPSGGGGC